MAKGMAQQSENTKTAITSCILIGVFLVTVFAATLVPRASMQTWKVDDAATKALKETYHAMFGSKPVNASDYYGFNTPVPMYLAAIIGLKSGGWNATALQNMTVYASLAYCCFASGNSSLGYWNSFENLHSVTEPVSDYSPSGNYSSVNEWVTYRYLWVIVVDEPSSVPIVPPSGLYYVDAATAELVSLPAPY